MFLIMEIMPLVLLYVQQSYWLNRLCLPRFNTSQRFFHEGHVPLLCNFQKKHDVSYHELFEQHFCIFRNQPASARHCERGWIWGKGCQVNWRDIWQWLVMSYVHQDFWVPSCLSLCVLQTCLIPFQNLRVIINWHNHILRISANLSTQTSLHE